MDGALERLAATGEAITLFWSEAGETLKARIAFHVTTAPSDALLQELTSYVTGQILDGYGEGPIWLPDSIEIQLDGSSIEGPLFVEDGMRVPGPTPEQLLFWAIEDGDVATAQTLLAQGADPNAAGKFGNTPLHAAVMKESAELVTLLLANRADPNHVDGESFGPLSAGAMTGNATILALLLDAGASPDVLHPDDLSRRMTPLAWAANRDNTAAAKLLISHGANVNAQCARLCTPLMYADTPAMAELLLANGADPNIRDEHFADARAHHLQQAAAKEQIGMNGETHDRIAALIAKATP
jgi:ankyrin repeat protein